MQISYSKPLDHAWHRMKAFLFQPFDLGKWFVLGFTAWLADLAGGSSGSASEQLRISEDLNKSQVRDWYGGGLDFLGDVFSHPWALLLAGMIMLGVIAIGLLVLWISSRGRFMFLDNLVHTRTEVKAPWTEFQSQGDSLFLWQVVYSIIVFVVIGSLFVGGLMLLVPLAALDTPPVATVPLIILAGTAMFVLITTLVFVEFFLTQFVVPIMYRHRISATEAWRRFLPLFKEHPGSFVLFGLFYFGIVVVGGILYLAGGLLTCCIGLILMAIPYIGTVITLPLHTLAKFLSLEFLGQFGDDFRLLQPWPEEPVHPYDSNEIQGDGTMVGPQDPGEDPGGGQPGPENF
ncbi:MAG: hypothetical protein ABFS42_06340 [Candidatus Krumholzibacteriota bacterium]